MSKPDAILIIGASARAAAASSDRAGLSSWGIDLFGDSDLPDSCQFVQVPVLSQNALGILDLSAMPHSLMLTGGMENRLELLKWLTKTKRLLGSSIQAIEHVKDPFELANLCRRSEIMFPKTLAIDSLPIQGQGEWLVKPRHSAGGSRIRTFSNDSLPRSTNSHCYLQKHVPGRSMSSVFCRSSESLQLIGSTEQINGCPAFSDGRSPYLYCGSIGPIQVGAAMQQEIFRIGSVVAKEFNLRGVFGLDWIWQESGQICLIEVNPRWTASCEIFERVGVCESIVEMHLDACCNSTPKVTHPWNRLCGKAIVYNGNESIAIDDDFYHRLKLLERGDFHPVFADIPRLGQCVGPHEPILSVYSEHPDYDLIWMNLRELAKQVTDTVQ